MGFRDLTDMAFANYMSIIKENKNINIKIDILFSSAQHIHLVWITAHLKLESPYLVLDIRE